MAGLVHSLGQSARHVLARLLQALMSLNDPQWGKRPGGGNQGPPDLDEVWRNFQKKFGGLFGKGGGGNRGGGDSGTPITPKQIGGGAVVLLSLILGIWLASGFYIVNEGHNGVVLRLGRRQLDERFERFLTSATRVISTRGQVIAYIDLRYANGFAVGLRN